MLIQPNIDPVAIHLGSFSIHWYGLMYLFSFLCGWAILSYRKQSIPFTREQIADLVCFVAFGVVLGGRIGYMVFYAWPILLDSPLSLFKIWEGGMSFHGGLIGVMIALFLYGQKTKTPFFALADFIAPVIPIGLAAGRIGNFINDELWGRVTDVPWAIIFPAADSRPRHPSSLYEFFLEGVVLFIMLWIFSRKPKPRAAVSGLFLLGYGIFRFIIEFFREPDVQLGFVVNSFSEGQLLSLPMIAGGLSLLMWAYMRKKHETVS